MLELIKYMLRVYITPLLLVVIILPAYYFGWIQSQATFIIFLVIAGVTGQVIQYYVQEWQKRKSGIKTKKAEIEVVEEIDPLSQLPKEVQDLIKEGESLQGENNR